MVMVLQCIKVALRSMTSAMMLDTACKFAHLRSLHHNLNIPSSLKGTSVQDESFILDVEKTRILPIIFFFFFFSEFHAIFLAHRGDIALGPQHFIEMGSKIKLRWKLWTHAKVTFSQNNYFARNRHEYALF